jgi:hypothetical protein
MGVGLVPDYLLSGSGQCLAYALPASRRLRSWKA